MMKFNQSSRSPGICATRRTTFVFIVISLSVMVSFYSSPLLSAILCEKDTPPLPVIPDQTEQISSETLTRLKVEWLKEVQDLAGDSKVSKKKDLPFWNNWSSSSGNIQSIDCLINDDTVIECLKSNMHEKDEVYLPFSFIQKYFDVTGTLDYSKDKPIFQFKQSYAKVASFDSIPYVYHGVYMNMANQNVEYRDRVKCISGVEGVPLSNQWSKDGYFYAVQIAQYGLSHYSKNLAEKSTKLKVLENGEDGLQSKWEKTSNQAVVEIHADEETGSNVVHFSVSDNVAFEDGVVLNLKEAYESMLSFDINFITSGAISVQFHVLNMKKQYTVHYVTKDFVMSYDSDTNIFYGIGKSNAWRHISRDLVNDFQRGTGDTGRLRGQKKFLQVTRIGFRGEGYIDNITLSKTAHVAHFNDAIKWILKNQDQATGGWKNEIVRTFKHRVKTLKSGWISAMGQGQCISLFARAFYTTGDNTYVRAMSQALKPFTIPSEQGGVKAVFMKKYVWYEEYPTTPSSFVLNGFMFSMLGLYDYKSLLEDKFNLKTSQNLSIQIQEEFQNIGVNLRKDYELTCRLYNDGMTSLKAMLPLYDGGSRTYYDLNHFMLRVPPNIARWDYHTLHLRQLALFYSITKNPIFKRYFEYWDGYTKGKFAPHN